MDHLTVTVAVVGGRRVVAMIQSAGYQLITAYAY